LNLTPEEVEVSDKVKAITQEIESLGYQVEMRDFLECAEMPGFLGHYAGVTMHDRKTVRIATANRTTADILAALEHEVKHVRGEELVDDCKTIRCGGHRGVV
jgi:hypothetical protein